MNKTIQYKILLCFFVFGLVYSHKGHHDVEVDNWWESLVEFEPTPPAPSEELSPEEFWTASENLATFTGVKPIKSVTLPVVINLLFSGFDGFGNQLIKLSEEQFEPWFGHIEHQIPHIVIPMGEEQTTTNKSPTQVTKIKYGFHLNLVRLSAMFTTVLQSEILWNLRPEIPEDAKDVHDIKTTKEVFYADANRIGSFLQAAAEGLGISNTYNLFVLNPLSAVSGDQIYGYRNGMSDAELNELQSISGELRRQISEMEINIKPCDDSNPQTLPKFLMPTSKDNIQVVDLEKVSAEWARWFLKRQLAEVNLNRTSWPSNPEATTPDDPSLVFGLPRGEIQSVKDIARLILENGNEFEKEYIFRALETPDLQQECLVDTWVTSGRTVWLDLSAGPFQWGPLISGEGTRTNTTVPRVPNRKDLQRDKVQKEHAEAFESRKDIQNKLISLKRFFNAHCTSDEINKSICEAVLQEIHSWRNQLASISEVIQSEIEGSEREGEGADWIMDNFLSMLSSTISSGLRHVFVPGVPLFPTDYYPTIIYHVFFISNHKNYDPRGDKGFDFDHWKSQLLRLKFPSQNIKFIVQSLQMGDSEELSAAFSNSLQTSVLPMLSPEGHYSLTKVNYIDSMALRDTLAKMKTFRIDRKVERIVNHVPVLFFSLDNEEYPILIDKFYSAKALANMVLIVQNTQTSYPSRLSCNSKLIMRNLRNPLQQALSATASHVAGIVAPHVSYSEAHQGAVQNWLWSVGNHPGSHTSSGVYFNQIQIDTMKRNVVVQELSELVDFVNQGVKILSRSSTKGIPFSYSQYVDAKKLKSAYLETIRHWERICSRAISLDFASAVPMLDLAFESAKEFVALALDMELTIKAIECIPHTTKESSLEGQLMILIPILFVIFDVFLFVVVFLCRRSARHVKRKIN